MNKGKLQQLDTPQMLYDHPANLFVAGFIGSPAMNFFNGKILVENGEMFVDMDTFRVKVPAHDHERYESVVGKDIIFGIRPEDTPQPGIRSPPALSLNPLTLPSMSPS